MKIGENWPWYETKYWKILDTNENINWGDWNEEDENGSDIKVGDKVIKNPETWIGSVFDNWGAGIGIGIIVKPPFDIDDDDVDVKWENGRCFQKKIELIKVN